MALNETQKRCTATTRKGSRCNNPAEGKRTVCRMHGGHAGRPIVHGLYSKELPEQIKEQIEAYMQNEKELLDLRPLIATLKVRANELNKNGALKDNELAALIMLVEKAANIIDKHEKLAVTNKNVITPEMLSTVLNYVVAAVSTEASAQVAAKIIAKLRSGATEPILALEETLDSAIVP